MMRQFAKEENKALVYAQDAEFRSIPNWRTNECAVRRRGYMPVQGEPEQREGYTAKPSAWHVVADSETRIEPRREDPVTHEPFLEDIMEEDPETHEMVKVGERQVTREVPVVYDKSYIQIDAWAWDKIPAPEPEPEPVVRYSKYKIQLATQKRGLWEQVKTAIAEAGLTDSWSNIVDIASDNQELQNALPEIRNLFGADVVNAVLEESIAD